MGLLGNAFARIADSNDVKRLATQEVPTGVTTLTYNYIEGNVFHRLNVYKAEGDNNARPTIIDIHGGGWYYGDKDLNRNFDKWFVKNGFNVVAISYRLIDKDVSFVEQVKDVFAAFNWIENNAKEQGFDLNNMFLMGDSAGSHLAGLAINITNNPQMSADFGVSTSLSFNAVNFTCGAFTPSKFTKLPIARSFIKPVIGKKFKKNPFYKYFDVTTTLSSCPPSNFVTCDGDFLKKMVLSTYKVFEQKGLVTTLIYVDKKTAGSKLPHVFNVLYPNEGIGLETNQKILAFFNQYTVGCY